MNFKKPLESTLLRRVGVILFSSLAILGTAGACSTGPLGNNVNITYGILKQDPSVRSEGFVRANSVQLLDGSQDGQGLTPLSVTKLSRVSKNELFALTKEKGLMKTTNAGVVWQRKYIFPLNGVDDVDGLDRNNSIELTDFAVAPNQPKVVYAAGEDKDGIGKIYQSLDGGENFKEIYSEIEKNIGVLFVTVDPINSLNVYAVLDGGALLRSQDGGITWAKIRSFKDTPVQIGFVREFGNLFYILFDKEGLAVSNDSGLTWDITELIKAPSEIGETQPEDGLDISFTEDSTFGKYEKIVPVTAAGEQSWLLVGDRQMWYAQNLGDAFRKLVLPVQSEQYDVYDVAPDPVLGLDKIYTSIDTRLFVTNDRGKTWDTRDKIDVNEGNIGNISQILIDTEDTQIIYLGLVNEKALRKQGLFAF